MWDALNQSLLDYGEWAVRKEFLGKKPILHLYVELRKEYPQGEVVALLHQKLKAVDPFYGDLEGILGIRPLLVTCLPRGTFDRFYDRRQKAGAELGRLRPPHTNATDEDIGDLMKAAGPALGTGP